MFRTIRLVLYSTLLISVLVVQGLYSERFGGHYVGLCVVFSVFQYTLALDCTCSKYRTTVRVIHSSGSEFYMNISPYIDIVKQYSCTQYMYPHY